jgi:uncharacterized protein YfaS (alpha-2-macroglobulin family)
VLNHTDLRRATTMVRHIEIITPGAALFAAISRLRRLLHMCGTAGLMLLALMLVMPATAHGAEKTKRSKGNAMDKPLVLVMNYPYQITGTGRTKIHVCLFKPDFTPAAGATVTVNGKAVGKADRHGVCIFDYVPGPGGSHLLKASLEDDTHAYGVTKAFSSNGRTESFRSDQIYVYTDRGVYNPGDTILARLIAWELLDDYKAIPGAEVTILLQGPGGKVFSGAKVKTNEYGIAALKIPVPENITEGNYELVVLYNKARETAKLVIKRFVPPIIEIGHDLKRYITPAQTTLPVNVQLSYFAGGKPKSARLRLSILDEKEKVIFTKDAGESKTAAFSLELSKGELKAARDKLALEKPCKIVLEVTDNFGQSSKIVRDVVYTARPFFAVLEFDKDDYPPGEMVQLLVKVLDLDGKPARNIDLKCDAKSIGVSLKGKTDDQGVAAFTFKMGKTTAEVVITSPIMPAPLGTGTARINVPKPMVSKVSEPPEKQGVQTRFTVTFDDDYVPVEKVVHVDFTDLSGGLVASGEIPVTEKSGGYSAQGTMTAPTWGTMLVNLYCCAMEKKLRMKDKTPCVETVGFVTEGQHVTLYPDCDASITVRDFKPRVKPGEEVTFHVNVRTRSGQDAALGAALVDKAVISLLDPFEVAPKDRFYNPQLKVISTGGAAVLTWPVVDRNWGNPWRDIAYSDWGFKRPGPMVIEGGRAEADGKSYSTESAGGSGGAMPTPSPAPPPGMPEPASTSPSQAQPAKKKKNGDALADAQAAERRRTGGSSEEPPPQKTITIRTKFPETALWEPHLKTEKGDCVFKAVFPDSITVQRLTIVATDKAGGLGVLHRDVEVRQDLFVRPDFPASMVLGDSVRILSLVRNSSGAPCTVRVSAESKDFNISGGASTDLALKDGEENVVEFTVTSARCGKGSFTVTAESDSFRDSETRNLMVLPAGEPVTEVRKGVLKAGAPFQTEVSLDGKATYHSVLLNVTFPDVIPALQAWDASNDYREGLGYYGSYWLAGRGLIDASFCDWASGKEQLASKVAQARQRMERIAAELSASQSQEGGWGWLFRIAHKDHPAFKPNLYLTSYVMRALTAIAAADIYVDPRVLERAAEFVMKARNSTGLWSYAYFWEPSRPDAAEADWALSADLLDALVGAYRRLDRKPDDALTAVKKAILRKCLKDKPSEAAAVGHGMRALLHWAEWRRDESLRKEVSDSAQWLLTLKRHGHWEPHWYHAYGGMVELNATILEVLQEMGAERYALEIRECVTWLLSTREAWGAWHNEIGTGVAMRALLKAGAGSVSETPSRVEVEVNGKPAAAVDIDPKDPFMSAVSMRHVDLTSYMSEGKNSVKVTYDGKLSAPVLLEARQWGLPGQGDRGGVTLRRTAPETAALGEPVKVTLSVKAETAVPLLTVTDTVPSNMSADEDSLKKILESGSIASYAVEDDKVRIVLTDVKGEVTVAYSLKGVRAGKANHRGARADVPTGQTATFTGGAITVTE